MNTQFKPHHELEVILAELERGPENRPCVVHRSGRIKLESPPNSPPEVRFQPPEYSSLSIEQMEAILEAMKKFQIDENPKPDPDCTRQTDSSDPQRS